jgi:hypothetical protein
MRSCSFYRVLIGLYLWRSRWYEMITRQFFEIVVTDVFEVACCGV